jgi:mRNA-degrading endonuclease toxin of MazEF toxin-antitoxin module
MVAPSRGEVWLTDLSPVRRPTLPITSTLRGIPSHVEVVPPGGGLKVKSAVLCDGVRSISTDRLHSRWGQIRPRTMVKIENFLRFLMRL